MSRLKKENAHAELLRSAAGGKLTERDALLWMVLLHTHAIHLRPGCVANLPDNWNPDEPFVLHAATQRGAAAAVAALWSDLKTKRGSSGKDERAHYAHWYWEFNLRTPYETLERIPADLMTRLVELRDRLARDSRVIAVIEED